MVFRTHFVGLILWALSFAANAACSGSGLTWSCTAGTTTAQISTAYTSASDGATLTFASGSYSWGGLQFSLSKGITLICAGGATCTVTGAGFTFPNGSSDKLYRISGFTFPSAADFMIWTCPSGGCSGTISKFRFDHNTVTTASGNHTIVIGENTSTQYVYGVIDNNSFSSSGSMEALYFLGAANTTAATTSPQGTVNNLFFEDNTITVTTMNNAGLGAIDGWGVGSAVVFRFNTVTNSLVTFHANETSANSNGGGFQSAEVYGNTLIATSGMDAGYRDGYRMLHHQGSNEATYFNNTFITYSTPVSDSTLSLNAGYIDSWCSSYPCAHGPGRDYKTNAAKPIYVWGNTVNGAKLDGNNEGAETYFAANRDYYNAVSANAQTSTTLPFNGTTGIGFGLLANRPTTCTTTAASGGGVGYWATDEGNWNGFVGAPQGRLYRCSATNTWTLHYTPYTYPHPLRVQGGPSSPGVN